MKRRTPGAKGAVFIGFQSDKMEYASKRLKKPCSLNGSKV
jgi:hypothetical protein